MIKKTIERSMSRFLKELEIQKLTDQFDKVFHQESKTIAKFTTYQSPPMMELLTEEKQASLKLIDDKSITRMHNLKFFSKSKSTGRSGALYELGLTEICLDLLQEEVQTKIKNLSKYFDIEHQDISSLTLSIRLHSLQSNFSKAEDELLNIKHHIEQLFYTERQPRIIISELILELIFKAQSSIKMTESSIKNNFNLLASLVESLISSYDPAVHQLLLITAEKIIEDQAHVFKIDNNKFPTIISESLRLFKYEAHINNLKLAKRIKCLAENIIPDPDLSKYQLLLEEVESILNVFNEIRRKNQYLSSLTITL